MYSRLDPSAGRIGRRRKWTPNIGIKIRTLQSEISASIRIFCVRINFNASWELHSKYWDSEKCEASDNKYKYCLQNEDWNPKPRSWQWNWDNWVIDQRSRTVFRPRSLKWNLLNKWGWAVFKVSLVAISFNLVLLCLGSDVSLISLTSLRSHSVNL